MSVLFFNNISNQSKHNGSFVFNSIPYNYVLYILPIKKQQKKQYENEIIHYFSNRIFKGQPCLGITSNDIQEGLQGNVSCYLIVYPVGVQNIASGTLQIYDWCNNTSANINDADVWINDVCREGAVNTGEPLKALFFCMEQLVVQNLGKTNIKLFIEKFPDENRRALEPKYASLGFVHNNEDNVDVCRHWGDDKELVMEKKDLVPQPDIIDFSFLQQMIPRKKGGSIKRKKVQRLSRKGKSKGRKSRGIKSKKG